jgi:NAD(P)-dependent dehydrogenase (short-subunit alcohol dehydrogenase family)
VAADLAPRIRVNAVSPGSTATEIAVHNPEGRERVGGGSFARAPDERFARVGEPIEIARVHLFLASDDSSFVNGQMLIADNGKTTVI